jgi:heme oxygenase
MPPDLAHAPSLASRLRPLTRIDDATRDLLIEADSQRIRLTEHPATAARYRRFLLRIYGFEVPVETALAATPGIDDVLDVRARLHTRLLKSDLAALGIVDLAGVARSRSVLQFGDVLEALGWIYVIERARMLGSILQLHLVQHLPCLAATSTSYLRAERTAATRMRELGALFDSVVRSEADAHRVLVAVHEAFRAQAHWYAE